MNSKMEGGMRKSVRGRKMEEGRGKWKEGGGKCEEEEKGRRKAKNWVE